MKIVIIGIGNEYRRDDAAGIRALHRLRALDPPGVVFADSDGEATSLIELWSGADLAIVIDGVAAGGEPGRLYRFGLHHPAVAVRSGAGSHQVSLGSVVALARALGRMPRQLLVFGIQVGDVSPGLGLTAAVERGVAAVVDEIAELLEPRPSEVGA